MAITNGYCTLAEFKERYQDAASYTAATLAFAASTKTISDSANGLARFQAGDLIRISGSTSNDGDYTVVTGDTAGAIVVSESLTDEAAGDSVTLLDITDPADDTQIEAVIEAASRAIDHMTGRRYYQASETRYYSAEAHDVVLVDDLAAVTALATDDGGDGSYGTTWQASDYNLWPYNASATGEPYRAIEARANSSRRFPAGPRTVKVTGTFGYAASAPEPIREACLLLSMRLLRRKDAPLGVIGGTGSQLIPARRVVQDDPDVVRLVHPYRRLA